MDTPIIPPASYPAKEEESYASKKRATKDKIAFKLATLTANLIGICAHMRAEIQQDECVHTRLGADLCKTRREELVLDTGHLICMTTMEAFKSLNPLLEELHYLDFASIPESDEEEDADV